MKQVSKMSVFNSKAKNGLLACKIKKTRQLQSSFIQETLGLQEFCRVHDNLDNKQELSKQESRIIVCSMI